MPTKVVGRRVAAFILDGIIVGVVNFALLIVVAAAGGTAETSGSSFSVNVEGGVAALYYLLAFAISIGYFVVWQGRSGATVGKRVMDLRLVKDDGSEEPPGPGRALARWLLFVADGFPYFIPYLTGFIVALASKRNQRIGDMVASTLVIRRDPTPPAGGPAV